MFISTPYINWMHVKYENKVTCKYWILHVGEESFCCMFLWLLIVHPESYDVKNCIMSRNHFRDCYNSFSNKDWYLHLSFLLKKEKMHILIFIHYIHFVSKSAVKTSEQVHVWMIQNDINKSCWNSITKYNIYCMMCDCWRKK